VSEVVTGEAVVLSVRVAGLPSRALALLIDVVLQGALMLLATILLLNAGLVVDEALGTALYLVLTVLVLVGYPVIFETATRGRSPGKMALGLRVVSDDGGPERFRQALFRGLAGVIEFWVTSGAAALFSSLISERGKRLGDVFAGTIVVGERAPRETPPPPMPAGLEGWAATLELARLPDDLANTARQYLTRWHQLAPHVRDRMGLQVATQVASCVAPPPPPGVPPHVYLAAVLAERRRRTEVRLGAAPTDRPGRVSQPQPQQAHHPPGTHEGGFAPPG
jgi:uncharacterized RDD family membrane protein YckC